MKAGRNLRDLAVEIERQAANKRDFIAPTQSVHLTIDEAAMDDFKRLMSEPVQQQDRAGRGRNRRARQQKQERPRITIDTSPVRITGLDNGTSFGIRPVAHGQIAEKLGIPKRYYDRLATEAPSLLVDNVNHWMQQDDDKRMFRTLDGNVRAFLSNRYQRMDYYDFLSAILPIIQAEGMHIESCEVTERKLYLKCLNERLKGKVVGDVVQAGLVFTDSETGFGRMGIQQMTYVLRCTNGMVGESVLGRAHLGRAQGGDDDRVQEMLQDNTKKLDDEVLWHKVRDVTRAMLTDKRIWERNLARLNEAAGEKIEGDVTGAVVELQKQTKITETARTGIMRHLIEGGDLSKWGVCNAVTRYAQDVDSYDDATDLEALGAKVIELPKSAWERIANAEPPKVQSA